MAVQDDLKELVVGVTSDIFRAEQCKALIDKIAENSVQLNDKNFGDLFGSIQGYLINEVILAVTRIYERPGGRYPNRSLRTTLLLIEDQADELPIANRELLLQGLRNLSVGEEELKDKSDSDLNRLMADTCKQLLPDANENPKLAEAQEALRAIRDKQIAHHENVSADDLPKTTWGTVDDLLNVPKKIVGIIGNAYLNTAYVDSDGIYILTSDADRASIALNRLLKNAGLEDES